MSNTWRAYPLHPTSSINTPVEKFDGDSIPTSAALQAAMGLHDLSSATVTQITTEFGVFTFGDPNGLPCVFALIRTPLV